MPCVRSILLPSTVRPSVSTGCSTMLDQVAGFDGNGSTYPPYNIERTGENAYRITARGRGLFRARDFDRGETEHADDQGREAGQGRREEGRGALSGHRRTRLRARLPARRARRGPRRVARERAPARRPRARGPGGHEAAPDPDRNGGSKRESTPRRPDSATEFVRGSAPDIPGRFCFGGEWRTACVASIEVLPLAIRCSRFAVRNDFQSSGAIGGIEAPPLGF